MPSFLFPIVGFLLSRGTKLDCGTERSMKKSFLSGIDFTCKASTVKNWISRLNKTRFTLAKPSFCLAKVLHSGFNYFEYHVPKMNEFFNLISESPFSKKCIKRDLTLSVLSKGEKLILNKKLKLHTYRMMKKPHPLLKKEWFIFSAFAFFSFFWNAQKCIKNLVLLVKGMQKTFQIHYD